MKKTQEMQNFQTTVKTTKYALKLMREKKSGKRLMVLQNLSAFIDVFPPIIVSIFPGLMINELIGAQRMEYILAYVLCLLVLPAGLTLLRTLIGVRISRLTNVFNLEMNASFYDHVMCMDYDVVENPDIQTIKERAMDTLSNVVNVSANTTVLLSAILRLILISSIISTLNPLIIVLVIVILIVNSVITKKSNYQTHLIGKELSDDDRFLWAYTYMMGNISYAKEVRLFQLNRFLTDKFVKFKSASDEKDLKMEKIARGRDSILVLTGLFQQIILYAYLLYHVLRKGMAVGSIAIYIATVGQFSGALSYVFNTYLNLENDSLRIQELISFMNLPLHAHQNGQKEPVFDAQSVIEFRDVSFAYPGSDRYILKHLNLTLKAGEKLCIVGENGVGKSTFIKLLTGLYTPTEGEILFNHVNIKDYDFEKYQRLFSPVFQDCVHYYFSVGENIMLANEKDPARLDAVCRQSGLDSLIRKLSKGYETSVGKFLDESGFEPSGGEEQRMSIARACYRGGDIFLLDEPTAALDPNAEYEIYTQFHQMIEGRTAVLITHRLSAVQLADRVVVFEDGHVAESGTHASLYAKGGIYTEMFDKQAKFYRDAPQEETTAEEAEAKTAESEPQEEA